MRNAAPLLPARLLPAAPGVSAQFIIRCDWCEDDHVHGAFPGHRAAHCTCAESPYSATGYELSEPSRSGPARVAPTAVYIGRQRLHETLARIAPRYRSTLLAAILGARPGLHFDKRVGSARISVFGVSWIIDPDAYPSRAELRGPPKNRALAGRDSIGLLAALHGMARGVVGVRLFEAITGAVLDAEGRRAIAAEIEAAYARAAEGGRA